MKPVLLFAALLTISLLSCSAHAQTPTTDSPADAEALTLLTRMLQAEKDLNLSGDQVTVLYRPEQTFSATQTIEKYGDRAFKLQYHSPAAVNGEVYVDNGKIAWHSIPSAHRLEVGPSGLGRERQESYSVLRKLQTHQLTVQLVGHDVIADQITQIVQVTAQGSWGERKYWIDPVTGAQLKIQTFGAYGQVVSETYFTKISYDSTLVPTDFGPPPVDASVQTVPMMPPGSTIVTTLPTSAESGFPIMIPSFMPSGFNFQSGVLMPLRGQKLVGLNYENGLNTLSIFEQPIRQKPGSPPPLDEYLSPRQGVLTARTNGYRYIVVGALPEAMLQQVVQSMH
jgi:negative regulator of sigma E activity